MEQKTESNQMVQKSRMNKYKLMKFDNENFYTTITESLLKET